MNQVTSECAIKTSKHSNLSSLSNCVTTKWTTNIANCANQVILHSIYYKHSFKTDPSENKLESY